MNRRSIPDSPQSRGPRGQFESEARFMAWLLLGPLVLGLLAALFVSAFLRWSGQMPAPRERRLDVPSKADAGTKPAPANRAGEGAGGNEVRH